MNLNYIEIINSDKVCLYGLYSGKKNKTCIIYIPGLGATFSSSIISKKINEFCQKSNCDFLFAANQGSNLMSEILVYDDKTSCKNGGASYENYNNWFSDMDAWFDYLKNYEEIIVIAHSLGCNKIVDYISKKKIKNVRKIFLLSPQDLNYLVNLDKHKGLYEEAVFNHSNNDNKLLSKLFLGFCYLSTETYLDFCENKKINNIPYLTDKDFSIIKSIDIPIFIIIGSNDKKISLENELIALCDDCKNVSYKIIIDANHNYNNKEEELMNLIFNMI